MADGDQKIEFELALRESMSVALQTVGREMAKLNKQAQETAQSGSGLRNIDSLLTSMGKSLLGPLGIAAGFVAAAKSLDAFAVSQLQIRNFARDTGFSTEQVSKLRAQLAIAGVDAGRTSAAIGGIGQKIQDAASIPFGSDMVKQLLMFNPELARTVQHFSSTGEQIKVLEAIHDAYIKSSVARQNLITQATGLTRTEILAIGRTTRDLAKDWVYSTEASEKYHKDMYNLSTSLSNIWRDVSQHAVEEIGKVTGSWEEMDTKAHAVADNIKKFMDESVIQTVKTTVQEFTAIVDQLDKIEAFLNRHTGKEGKEGDLMGRVVTGTQKSFGELADDLILGKPGSPLRRLLGGKTPDELAKERGESGGGMGGLWNRLFKRQSYEGGADEAIEFSAKSHAADITVKELLDTESDSNKLLRDIRDMMQREDTIGGGGGGGPAFRSGIGPGSRRRGGGGGGGTEDTTGLPEYEGGTGGGGTGIDRTKWREELLSNPQLRERLYRHALGENTNPLANQAIMEEAANRADIRGAKSFADKGNLNYFAGYYRGVITDKMRKMLDENFRKVFFEGSDEARGAIDNSSGWLLRKHEQVDHRFKTVRTIAGEGFEIPWLGESGSGERARYPEFRRRQLAQMEAAAKVAAGGFKDRFISQFPAGGGLNERALLNSALARSAGAGPVGTLNAEVDFKNVPPGVRTSADGSGFKMLKVTATKQAQRAGEGMLYPGDSAYTPWVP